MSHTNIENKNNESPLATIHIGHERTVVDIQTGPGLKEQLILAVGSTTTATLFKHAPPTESEMENAIMLVEDELFHIRHAFPPATMLSTTDQSIHAIAVLGGETNLTVTRTAVEQVFNRLAAIIQGRPTSFDSIPTDREFCATLLILREFMHHLNFASLELKSPGNQTVDVR